MTYIYPSMTAKFILIKKTLVEKWFLLGM